MLAPRLHLRAALLLVLALPLAGAPPLAAQEPLPEPLVATLASGGRALALGWAAPLGMPDPASVLTHPGLVASEWRGDLAAGGAQLGYSRFTERATALSAAAVLPWFGGGVALGVQTVDYEAGTLPALGDLWPGDLASAGVGDGVSEMAASLTAGRRIGPLDVGVTGRVLTQRSGDRNRSLQGVDVGVAGRVGPVRVALSGRNLGSAAGLPGETVLGFGSRAAPVGPLDVAGHGQVRVREDGEVLAGGGVEVAYWPVQGRTFIARVGFRDASGAAASPLTLGFGFRGDEIQVDYAFLSPDDGDGLHRVSVAWR